MKSYTKKYLDHFQYCIEDFIPCEVCGARAVDIHHIDCRGMGNTGDEKDVIENLMAVCRQCHIKFGDKKQHIDFLKNLHQIKLVKHNRKYKPVKQAENNAEYNE